MSRSPTTFVCVLQAFPEMGPPEVDSICAQVLAHSSAYRAVCVSDLPQSAFASYVAVLPLARKYQGWWCLMEAFRIPGPVLFLGIDSVVVGDLAPLVDAIERLPDDEVIMYRPPKKVIADKGFWASGVMGWNRDLSWIADIFNKNPERWMDDHRFRKTKNGLRMEQDFTTLQIQSKGLRITAAQDICPGIYSYKREVRRGRGPGTGKLPEDSKLVLFHGKPRPQDAPEKYWEKFREVEYGIEATV